MKNKRIERYKELFKHGKGRRVFVVYERKEDKQENRGIWHSVNGIVKIVANNHIKLLVNREKRITIGYRTIIESYYLDSGWKIKSKLYYGKGKY